MVLVFYFDYEEYWTDVEELEGTEDDGDVQVVSCKRVGNLARISVDQFKR